MIVKMGYLYHGVRLGSENETAKHVLAAKNKGNKISIQWCTEVIQRQLVPLRKKFDVVVPTQSVNSKFSIPHMVALRLSRNFDLKFKNALHRNNRSAKSVKGLRVAVIDDVLDTGATARRVVKALERAGATVTVFVAVSYSKRFLKASALKD